MADLPAGFPFDLLSVRLTGPLGDALAAVQPWSMVPPWPWGPWMVAQALGARGDDVPGDLVECGVAAGGHLLLLGHLAASLGRHAHGLDTFSGLPEPTPGPDGPYFLAGDYAPPMPAEEAEAAVASLVAMHGLSETITLHRGRFADILDRWTPDGPLALVHVDADLYDSVHTAVDRLWDALSPGGLLVVDDVFHPAQGPARALVDVFTRRGLTPVWDVVFPYGLMTVKGETVPDALQQRAHDGRAYRLDALRADPAFRAAVAASHDRTTDPARRHRARLLLDLLDADPTPGDIYAYWHALQDIWHTIAARDPTHGPVPLHAAAADDGA